MKLRFVPPVVALMFIALVGCGDVGDAPEAQTGDAVTVSEASGGTYTIDTSRSSITWKGAKITRSHDGGFNEYSGTITVDGDNVTGATITIQTASIWSDTERLTGHLKGEDFFVVDSFPTATFEADRFEAVSDTSGATHMVTGNLMLRGNTRSVTFPATVNVRGNEVTAKADFKINRKEWGIIYPGAPDDLVSDDVRIIFDITAVREDAVAAR